MPTEQDGGRPSVAHLGKPSLVAGFVGILYSPTRECRQCGQLEEADKSGRVRQKGLERGQAEFENGTNSLERMEPVTDVAPALVGDRKSVV